MKRRSRAHEAGSVEARSSISKLFFLPIASLEHSICAQIEPTRAFSWTGTRFLSEQGALERAGSQIELARAPRSAQGSQIEPVEAARSSHSIPNRATRTREVAGRVAQARVTSHSTPDGASQDVPSRRACRPSPRDSPSSTGLVE